MAQQAITPLSMSQTKEELVRHLGMSTHTYDLMADETARTYTRVVSHSGNFRQPLNTPVPPFDWSDITELAKQHAAFELSRSTNPETAPYWQMGETPQHGNNWVAIWFLYHKFRYRDGRNRAKDSKKGTKKRDKAAITVGSSQGSKARNRTYNGIDAPDEQLSNDDDAGRTLVINRSKFEDNIKIVKSWMGDNLEVAIDVSEGFESRYTIEDEFSLFLPLRRKEKSLVSEPQDPYSSLGLLEEQVTEELATASQARSILDSLDGTFSSVDMIEPHIRKGRRDRFPSYSGGEKKYTGADSDDENIYARSIKKCSARQEKSAKCPYPDSDYASATRNDLQRHIDCLHSSDLNKKHRCPVCYESRLISRIDNFKTHLKTIHGDKLSEGEILEYVKQSKERVAAYREEISPNRPGATTSIRSSTESREPQLLKKYEPEKAHFERLEREDRDTGIKADNPPTTQPTTNNNHAGYDQRYDLGNDNDLSNVLDPQLGHLGEGASASGRSRYTERPRRERSLSRRGTNTTKGTGKDGIPVPWRIVREPGLNIHRLTRVDNEEGNASEDDHPARSKDQKDDGSLARHDDERQRIIRRLIRKDEIEDGSNLMAERDEGASARQVLAALKDEYDMLFSVQISSPSAHGATSSTSESPQSTIADDSNPPPQPEPEMYLPCVFKNILQTKCNELELTSFPKWRDHAERHIHCGTSAHDLVCLFCENSFQKLRYPISGDTEWASHTFHHLTKDGAVIEDINLNPHKLKSLVDHGILCKQRYNELCSALTANDKNFGSPAMSVDSAPKEEEVENEDRTSPPFKKAHQSIVRRRHRPHVSDGATDDELLAPLLSREPSPSSSAASSSNIDWLYKFTAPSTATLVDSAAHAEQEQKEADGTSSGTSDKTLAIGGTLSPGSYDSSTTSGGAPSQSNGSNNSSPSPNAPPPSQRPPNPPHDLSGKPSISRTKRVVNLLSCSEAIMFYIQSIQLCAISFQVACTTMYFNASPPPSRGTGKFSDNDYLSLLSTCLVQTIALALSLVGMRKKGDENLWIWTLTVASMSFLLNIASLVLYFVHTTFGNLFMCLAAVCQLWIWKFVIFGAREKDGAKSPRSDRSRSPDSDLEMQQVRTR